MDETVTRRAALGAVAVGVVVAATAGTAEAKLAGDDYFPGDVIPASFGRLVACCGDQLIRCIFEDEAGTLRVVGMYMADYGKVRLIHEYKRA